MTINCRSSVNKDTLIGQILRDEKIDFALLTETWYSDEKPHQYESSDLNQNGYKISVANRKNRIGGGIDLTYRNGITMRNISCGSTSSFEFGIWQLIFKSITMHVIGIYRPPSLASCTQFVSDFFNKIEQLIPVYSNLIINGDFNLHIQENSSTIYEFNNALTVMGLVQHVNFSTHVAGNSLDLVLTEAGNRVDVLSCEPGNFVSDHCSVKIVTKVEKESVSSKTISFRDFKAVEKDAFAADLRELSIETDTVDNVVEQFEDKVKRVLDIHAPLQEKRIISRPPKPRFTENILLLKRNLCRLWKEHKHPHLHDQFKEARNKYTHEINKEKCATLSQKVLDCKGDAKKCTSLYQN